VLMEYVTGKQNDTYLWPLRQHKLIIT